MDFPQMNPRAALALAYGLRLALCLVLLGVATLEAWLVAFSLAFCEYMTSGLENALS